MYGGDVWRAGKSSVSCPFYLREFVKQGLFTGNLLFLSVFGFCVLSRGITCFFADGIGFNLDRGEASFLHADLLGRRPREVDDSIPHIRSAIIDLDPD